MIPLSPRYLLLTLTAALFAACAPAGGGQPFSGPSVDFDRGPLRVSDDGRKFVHADGSPFFWLGDTAWHLFHRLDREEAERYLEDRRSKGFNVIQAVVLAEYGGLDVPNPYGATPLENNDPTRPIEAYFEHVDYIVDLAAEKGMYTGMLPTWGDKFNKAWGEGPEIFTPENARAYGEFLGARYRDRPVIWIVGGDRIPESDEHLAIVRAMAEGIRSTAGDEVLMTYHPSGSHSSSEWFHSDPWLDFNMFQSSHGAWDMPNYWMTERDRALEPVKPVLDGEPRYEDHPVNWRPEDGWFGEFDVRQAAYWSVLSGAAGHTYGDHNIWQMWQPGRDPVSSARTPWYEALEHPGAAQMGVMRRLFESRPFLLLEPAPEVLPNGVGEGPGYQVAARASDGSYLIAYTPLGDPLEVSLDGIQGVEATAYWFDPRTGEAQEIGTFAAETVRFEPPGEPGRGNDWVLVVDSRGAGFRNPPGG